MDKPVVTRLHGAVRAGGIGIVAASDIAIAAEDATFALTEVKLGLAAAIISLTVHHRMNPAGGGADHARRRGVHRRARPRRTAWSRRRCPADDLDAEVARGLRLAGDRRRRRGCASPSGSSTATWSPASTPTATRWPTLSARLFASDEAREAMTAFLSRKK